MGVSRRRAIALLAGGGMLALLGSSGRSTRSTADASDRLGVPERIPLEEVDFDAVDLPLEPAIIPLDYSLSEIEEHAMPGGAPPGGIPAINDPEFLSADAADGKLDPDEIVFGLVANGKVRAYPQRILVHHEIVNDTVAGTGIAVTYCPLTGTAIAFKRGNVSFLVSGHLANSNLIMLDRQTGAWWPQILGTGIRRRPKSILRQARQGGSLHHDSHPFKGKSLMEVPLVWTTWRRWRSVHPETRVLSEDTGYIRPYHRDPYGSYTPRRGYYKSHQIPFPVMHTDDRFHPKAVFVGGRTADGVVAISKSYLRNHHTVSFTMNGTEYLASYAPDLDTARITRVKGNEPVNAFDAMWFAWVAFYPSTEVIA